MTTRILKWRVPLDHQAHSIKGQFLHAEPMTAVEHEAGAWRHLKGDSDSHFVTIWTRVADGETDDASVFNNPLWDYQVSHSYQVFGTGWDIEDDAFNHCATVKDGDFVWHVLSKLDDTP